MPFYEYECENCKFYVEALQKISDPPLVKCPSCGKNKMKKLISAPVFRLKGGGWYETDFKSDKEEKRNLAIEKEPESSSTEAKGTEAKATEPKADAKPAASEPKTESKPAAKPAARRPSAAAASKARSRPSAKAKPAAKSKAKPAARRKSR